MKRFMMAFSGAALLSTAAYAGAPTPAPVPAHKPADTKQWTWKKGEDIKLQDGTMVGFQKDGDTIQVFKADHSGSVADGQYKINLNEVITVKGGLAVDPAASQTLRTKFNLPQQVKKQPGTPAPGPK